MDLLETLDELGQPPRRDNLQRRVQGHEGKLESDLASSC